MTLLGIVPSGNWYPKMRRISNTMYHCGRRGSISYFVCTGSCLLAAQRAMERPCIGSFLVGDDGNHGTASDFESHLSLLQQLSNERSRPRLLLEGPAPIASSLILDMGMSLASNEPCRCVNRVHQQCENCVAVAILRPFDEPDVDTFPMLCLPRNGNPEDTSSILFHRKQSLQRIQINRFVNSHDLLHYLLTMAGRSIHQLPMAGIFIDQLDRIIGMEEDPSEDATSDAMRKSQISMCFGCGDVLWLVLCSCLSI
jgi:hypothetical protein